MLRGIADVLRHSTPVRGHAGRLGGDEFSVAVALPADEALQVAESIRAGVEALRFPEWPQLRSTVSVGLAEATPDDTDLRLWSQRADRALYEAKARGRNAVGTVAAHPAAGTA